MRWRAVIYRVRGSEIVLTAPDHADMPEVDLVETAVQEAYRAGLIGTEPHQVTEGVLRERLYVGEWDDGKAAAERGRV